MPDITMCLNSECTKKKKCYRFTAKPSDMVQSYSLFKQDDKGDCEHFIPIKKKKK